MTKRPRRKSVEAALKARQDRADAEAAELQRQREEVLCVSEGICPSCGGLGMKYEKEGFFRSREWHRCIHCGFKRIIGYHYGCMTGDAYPDVEQNDIGISETT